MLTISQSKFVEKIITSPQGIQFRVLFLVYLEDGRVKAKVISSTAIETALPIESNTLAIAGANTEKKYIEPANQKINSKFIPSPYNSILYFNLSIPRGPNL